MLGIYGMLDQTGGGGGGGGTGMRKLSKGFWEGLSSPESWAGDDRKRLFILISQKVI